MTTSEVVVCRDKESLSVEAARRFVAAGCEATSARGRFTVLLSGGSTPQLLYALLAQDEWRDRVDWTRTHLFWGDERTVPPDHSDSNYRMAHEALLQYVPVPPAQIHRIKAENTEDANRVAQEYEAELREAFQLPDDQTPRFDFVLLGMGTDGHTASLFPGTDALDEKHRLVRAVWVEKLATHRITVSLLVINNAAQIMFLVNGAEKAEVLQTVLGSSDGEVVYPVQLVQPTNGKVLWLIDQSAASRLKISNSSAALQS